MKSSTLKSNDYNAKHQQIFEIGPVVLSVLTTVRFGLYHYIAVLMF